MIRAVAGEGHIVSSFCRVPNGFMDLRSLYSKKASTTHGSKCVPDHSPTGYTALPFGCFLHVPPVVKMPDFLSLEVRHSRQVFPLFEAPTALRAPPPNPEGGIRMIIQRIYFGFGGGRRGLP